jgi:hypothetical protein
MTAATSITVRVPLAIRHRPGRKTVVMPMADGAKYEVWITQSGLIARPTNEAARAASAGGFVRVS